MDHTINLLPPTTFPSVSFVVITSLSVQLLPASSPGVLCRPPWLHPHPPPSRLRRSSLCPTPRAYFCHRVPITPPPPCRPRPAPRSLLAPVGLTVFGTSVSLVTRLSIPVLYSVSHHLLMLGLWSVVFLCAKVRGSGASTPWQLLSPGSLTPPLIGHAGVVQSLCPPPPSPSPIYIPSGSLDPVTVFEVSGAP